MAVFNLIKLQINTQWKSIANVCFRKTGTKHSSVSLLLFVPVFYKQTLFGTAGVTIVATVFQIRRYHSLYLEKYIYLKSLLNNHCICFCILLISKYLCFTSYAMIMCQIHNRNKLYVYVLLLTFLNILMGNYLRHRQIWQIFDPPLKFFIMIFFCNKSAKY